ncbi:hypothetical protein DWX97_15310 [Bacteroides cellulosilyticus]|uniref:Uncharacterized protein n=1 Tax=Bacteroides cellulosilyticus TaxID=246787 RepID=A0A412IF91_9BACE|nr:hypothetical protein DWX97_15310 [Bacteroides cellulosilyticus]
MIRTEVKLATLYSGQKVTGMILLVTEAFPKISEIDSGCIICRIYIHVFCIKQAVYAIRMQETILLSQRNYGWDANNL